MRRKNFIVEEGDRTAPKQQRENVQNWRAGERGKYHRERNHNILLIKSRKLCTPGGGWNRMPLILRGDFGRRGPDLWTKGCYKTEMPA